MDTEADCPITGISVDDIESEDPITSDGFKSNSYLIVFNRNRFVIQFII